jgi:O-acetyl-ADP-ribose deacetylase (regulator of RNase III)
MTVQVIKGDLFKEDFQAIAHGVNVYGLMGAGIAVPFRERYPEMYEEYVYLCRYQLLTPGDCYLYEGADEFVMNIASQDRPGPNAKVLWLAQGLFKGLSALEEIGVQDVGLPWIGCGIGGLAQGEVKDAIEDTAERFPTLTVTIVEL